MDIWRIGLVEAPIAEIAAKGSAADFPVRWLPEEPALRFLADPFGLWRDGRLVVFAEAFDYRTRHGVIDLLEFGADLVLADRRTVLREPWHLSYPQVFEAEGAIWMAPEAHRSGAFTLYRADAFPDRWTPVVRLELDTPAIDATVIRHGGLWWLAYSPAGPQSFKQGRLHLAYAEALGGPWRAHPGNPVRIDRTSSRPGGTPFIHDGALMLPVQDCVRSYGSAIRLLKIDEMTPDRFQAEASAAIAPPQGVGAYRDGFHTLSGAGPVTLVDAKRIDGTPRQLAAALGERLRGGGG
jgi:hypothetical protein